MKTYQKKSHIEKTRVFRKTKFEYNVRPEIFKHRLLQNQKKLRGTLWRQKKFENNFQDSVPKNLKQSGTHWNFLTFVLLQNTKKISRTPKIFERKSHKAEKGGNSEFRILVEKLAHTHGFEHEPSGSKSKHLTTRPRTPELCDLGAETRVVARKKSTRISP